VGGKKRKNEGVWTKYLLLDRGKYILAGVFLEWDAPERRAVSSFSEGRKPEWRSGNFFPGIDITNTSPSPTEFWVTMRFETYFL
jgi:hypothetical protein